MEAPLKQVKPLGAAFLTIFSESVKILSQLLHEKTVTIFVKRQFFFFFCGENSLKIPSYTLSTFWLFSKSLVSSADDSVDIIFENFKILFVFLVNQLNLFCIS